MTAIRWLVRLCRRFALALGFAACAAAAQTYPTQPVTLIVPFPPAGGVDVMARLLAKELGERMGQNVVVDNRPGAAGNLGTGIFAKAPPDGYTLLFTAQSPVTIAGSISKRLPFDPARDLVPVVLTHLSPVLVVVPAASPVQTLADLATLSRQSPGRFFFGSPGTGNEVHLVTEWIKRELQLDITHVPYKGSGPALLDLIANRTQVMVASPGSVTRHIAEGRLRAIATLSAQRLPTFPQVPTASESGYPQLVFMAWSGLFVPRDTPASVIATLEKHAADVAAHPPYRRRIAEMGLEAVAIGASEFGNVIRKDRALWSGFIPSLNLSEDIYK